MRNNRGISLVEIIVSVSLIGVVLLFLFSMLITVRSEDAESREQANMLINQALIIKEIETDFIELELMAVTSCHDRSTLGAIDTVRSNLIIPTIAFSATYLENINCLKLLYNPSKTDSPVGYLLYYSYLSGSKETNLVGYKRGTKRVLREVPYRSGKRGIVQRRCAGGICALTIELPVLNLDADDYGINLSYVTENSCFKDNCPSDADCQCGLRVTKDSDNAYVFDYHFDRYSYTN